MQLHTAVFYTSDLEESVNFYQNLGFQLKKHQNATDKHKGFATFQLENAELGLKEPDEAREQPGKQAVFIDVSNVKQLHGNVAHQAPIYKELKLANGLGLKFSILDPDGNQVTFLQRDKHS